MIDNALLEALGKTLVDSIGQGLAVLLITIIALWLTQKKSARVRHNILLVSILVLPILSVNSFVNSYEPRLEVMHNAFVASELLDFAALDMSSSSEFDVSTNEIEQENAFVPPTVLIWLSYAWIVGFSFYLIRIFGSFFYLNRLNRKARRIEFTHLNDLLNRIKVDLGLKRQVILKTSERVTSPLIYGVFKPIIIFPLGLIQGLTTEEVEAILLHELSHLKRNDFIINIVINVLKIIYFYHPAFWWMSVQLDNEREFASDEMVLYHKANALDLIKALSKTQEYQMSVPAVAFAGSSKNQLLKRVNRIMKKQQKPNWLGGLLALMILASAFLLTSQQSKEKVDKSNEPESDIIDSVLFKEYDPKLDISERDTLKPFLFQLPVFNRVNDSLIYSHTLVSNFGKDTLTVEKALAEIVQKKQKFILEKLENGEITNVTRGRSELKGDSLKVYKKAFEFLEEYKRMADKVQQIERERELRETVNRMNQEIDQSVRQSYQENIKTKRLSEVEREIEQQERNQKLAQRERLLTLHKRAEALTKQIRSSNIDKQVKVDRMEQLLYTLSEMRLNPQLSQDEMNDTMDFMDEGFSMIKEYYDGIGEPEKADAIFKKIDDIDEEARYEYNKRDKLNNSNQELQELKFELQRLESKLDFQKKRAEVMVQRERLLAIQKENEATKNEQAERNQQDNISPSIWVVSPNKKDTIKTIGSLGEITMEDVIEFRVVKGKAAKKLDSSVSNGVIIIEVKRAAFTRHKRQQQKSKKSQNVYPPLKTNMENPKIYVTSRSSNERFAVPELSLIDQSQVFDVEIFSGTTSKDLDEDIEDGRSAMLIVVKNQYFDKIKDMDFTQAESKQSWKIVSDGTKKQTHPSFDDYAFISFDLTNPASINMFWKMMDELEKTPKLKFIQDSKTMKNYSLQKLSNMDLSNYTVLNVIRPEHIKRNPQYKMDGEDAIIQLKK